MVDKVFCRVFKEEPNLNLLWEFMDYCDGVGLYSDEGMQLAYWKQKNEESVRRNTVCKLGADVHVVRVHFRIPKLPYN
jgi:hypothetical protein